MANKSLYKKQEIRLTSAEWVNTPGLVHWVRSTMDRRHQFKFFRIAWPNMNPKLYFKLVEGEYIIDGDDDSLLVTL